MAVCTLRAEAPPEQVWRVLADGHRYADWVLGTRCIRAVEGDWPHRGAKVHHEVGLGPLRVRDFTEVVDVEPGRILVLDAHVGPLGAARVRVDLVPSGAGSLVTLTEEPVGVPGVIRLVLELPGFVRNVLSLRRLASLASAG